MDLLRSKIFILLGRIKVNSINDILLKWIIFGGHQSDYAMGVKTA